jgi:nucleoid-associated protein YgaU
MKRRILFYLLGIFSAAFIASGCVVRTYPLTRERIDQDLNMGNRGYLKGQAPAVSERKTTRTTQVVEVEIHSPIRFERMPKTKIEEKVPSENTEDKSLTEGNRGYIMQSTEPKIIEPEGVPSPSIEKYTVKKNDTLQKISKKFYGTTKKWTKIYEANKDILKGPNKLYVGQVLNITLEPGLKETLKETKENLK